MLTEFVDTALMLLSDVVMNPTFPADELENMRRRTLTALEPFKANLIFPDGLHHRHQSPQQRELFDAELGHASALRDRAAAVVNPVATSRVRKPRRLRSLLIASDSGVLGGTSRRARHRFTFGWPPTNCQM